MPADLLLGLSHESRSCGCPINIYGIKRRKKLSRRESKAGVAGAACHSEKMFIQEMRS